MCKKIILKFGKQSVDLYNNLMIDHYLRRRIMSKVAKLVWITVGTRVIVDENATEGDIIDMAREEFFDSGNFEDFVERIEDDVENPYDPVNDGNEEE